MKLSVKNIFCSVLFSHIFGMALLILLSSVAMMLSYPSESVMLVGVLSLSLGGAFLGFYLRGRGAALPDALCGGFLYAGIPFVLSLFSSEKSVGLGYRLLLVAVTVLLAVLPSWVFKKKKKYRRVRR